MNKEEVYIYISNQTGLESFIKRIKEGELVANEFEFNGREDKYNIFFTKSPITEWLK